MSIMQLFWVCLFAFGTITQSYAQTNLNAVNALIPSLVSTAEQARKNLVQHPTLTAFEIEAMLEEAANKLGMVIKGTSDISRGRELLTSLEQEVAPIREIPSFKMHVLLAKFAAMEGRAEDLNYHWAYAKATQLAIARTGTGASPETAIRVVMLSEEHDWFWTQEKVLQKESRVSQEIGGKKYDVWHATSNQGKHLIYFDVSAMQESLARVFAIRAGNKQSHVTK